MNISMDKDQNADPQFSKFVSYHQPLPSSSKFISMDPDPCGVPNWIKGVEQLKDWYPNFSFYHMTSDEFFQKNIELLKSECQSKRVMGIVDGDHTPSGCLKDLENLYKLNTGLIIVDDTIWLPQLGNTAKQFAVKRNYQCTIYPYYN